MRATLAASLIALAACGGVDPDGPDVDGGIDDDPLLVVDPPAPGSLDELHANIIKPRCSGTPGLCHNGQFEPNLSTPGLSYAYLVRRPGLEKPGLLRVDPERPETSLLIDKLRNRNGVATQMPLGAEPLEEADIAAIEAWISAGGLRAPGDAAAPVLNNPPRKPELGVFAGTVRLDDGGAALVSPGQTITLRHTVQDFETADASIPFAAVLLLAADGRSVVLEPGAGNPAVGVTSYDAGGPPAIGDVFDFRRTWAIGTTIELYDDTTGMTQAVTAAGQTLTPVALYYDDAGTDGIAAFALSPRTIRIQ